jgi:hypothetical protein
MIFARQVHFLLTCVRRRKINRIRTINIKMRLKFKSSSGRHSLSCISSGNNKRNNGIISNRSNGIHSNGIKIRINNGIVKLKVANNGISLNDNLNLNNSGNSKAVNNNNGNHNNGKHSKRSSHNLLFMQLQLHL